MFSRHAVDGHGVATGVRAVNLTEKSKRPVHEPFEGNRNGEQKHESLALGLRPPPEDPWFETSDIPLEHSLEPVTVFKNMPLSYIHRGYLVTRENGRCKAAHEPSVDPTEDWNTKHEVPGGSYETHMAGNDGTQVLEVLNKAERIHDIVRWQNGRVRKEVRLDDVAWDAQQIEVTHRLLAADLRVVHTGDCVAARTMNIGEVLPW